VNIGLFAQSYNYVAKWGSFGIGNGCFNIPAGIAIDSSGYVYVSDSGNHRIQKFAKNGTFISAWGTPGSGAGQFNNPSGIAINLSGNIYVSDFGNDRVQKFDSGGTFITAWGSTGSAAGQFSQPEGICCDNSGNVYVAEYSNHRVQKFDSNGTYLTSWGNYGTLPGQFYRPVGVTADNSGNVYVADSGNNRVQKFDSNGNYLAGWGSPGAGNGQFNEPDYTAVDASGNVYVTDSSNDRIQKFASDGTYLKQWGSYGDGDGQYKYLRGIALDSAGNVYVVDYSGARVQVSNSFPVISGPTTATVVQDGSFNYQITATNNQTIYGATNLPPGLTVNTGTGLITGFPSGSGTTDSTISATNVDGTGTAVLTIAVYPAKPKLTTFSPVTGMNFFPVTLTINGQYFFAGTGSSGVSSVKAGTTSASILAVPSDSSMIAIVPACMPPGTYDITAATAGGTTETIVQKFVVTTAGPNGAPSKPDFTCANSAASITFTWTPGTVNDPVNALTGYYLQVGTVPGGNDKFDGDAGTALSFSIAGCGNGVNYFARVRAKNSAGYYSAYSDPSSGAAVAIQSGIKVTNNLIGPSNAQASIQYTLTSDSMVKITVHDSNGRQVRTLLAEFKAAGAYSNVSWDGKSDSGESAPSGMYIVFINAGSYKDRKKIIIVR